MSKTGTYLDRLLNYISKKRIVINTTSSFKGTNPLSGLSSNIPTQRSEKSELSEKSNNLDWYVALAQGQAKIIDGHFTYLSECEKRKKIYEN